MRTRYLVIIGALLCGLIGLSAESHAAASCPGGGTPTKCKAHCTLTNPPVCTETCECAITGKSVGVSSFTARARTGTITAIDVADKTFTCHWQASDWTYQLTDKTSFQVGEKVASLADLKVGATVQVAYHEDGNAQIADQVTITAQ